MKPQFEKAKKHFRDLSKKRKIDVVVSSCKKDDPSKLVEKTWQTIFAMLYNKWDEHVTWQRMKPIIKKKFLDDVESFDMEQTLEDDQLHELRRAVTKDEHLREPDKLKKSNLIVYTLANWLHALHAFKEVQPQFNEIHAKTKEAKAKADSLKSLCNHVQVTIKTVEKEMAKSAKALKADGANDVGAHAAI